MDLMQHFLLVILQYKEFRVGDDNIRIPTSHFDTCFLLTSQAECVEPMQRKFFPYSRKSNQAFFVNNFYFKNLFYYCYKYNAVLKVKNFGVTYRILENRTTRTFEA